jgi:hypothetical protein
MKTLSNVLKSAAIMFAAVVLTSPASAGLLRPGATEELIQSARDRHAMVNSKAKLFSLPRRHAAFSSPSSPDPAGSLATFNRSFVFGNTSYNARIVGSDPAGPATTTTITTLIVPLRIDLGNGDVRDADHDLVDGQTVLADVLGSPLFNAVPWSCGPIFLGNLQYADAFQRANFWNDLANKPGHHLVLNPVVGPTKTIIVPPNEIIYQDREYQGIDFDWFDAQMQALIPQLGTHPNQLVIFLAAHGIGPGATGGYHSVIGNSASGVDVPVKLPAATYIVTASYPAPDSHASLILSHEIIEWENDPYVNNEVPAWEFPAFPPYSYDVMESCDPFEFLLIDNQFANIEFPVVVNGATYYIFEAAFFDYFSRAPVSQSANGWYCFHNLVSTFSMSGPIDGDKFVEKDIDFPGAAATFPAGINDRGNIVGYYRSPDFSHHGFIYSNGTFQSFDPPGSSDTFVLSINDPGEISGTFSDVNGSHGFLLQNGHFSVIDYPNGQTQLEKINSRGQAVGTSYPNSGAPSIGFSLGHNGLTTLPPLPFGYDVSPTGINDSGLIVGTYDDFSFNASGYLENGAVFSHLDFPAATSSIPTAINAQANSTGYLSDYYGLTTAFYKRGDTWLHILYGGNSDYGGFSFTILQGMNNSGDAVGTYLDNTTGLVHGMVLTPIPGR